MILNFIIRLFQMISDEIFAKIVWELDHIHREEKILSSTISSSNMIYQYDLMWYIIRSLLRYHMVVPYTYYIILELSS